MYKNNHLTIIPDSAQGKIPDFNLISSQDAHETRASSPQMVCSIYVVHSAVVFSFLVDWCLCIAGSQFSTLLAPFNKYIASFFWRNAPWQLSCWHGLKHSTANEISFKHAHHIWNILFRLAPTVNSIQLEKVKRKCAQFTFLTYRHGILVSIAWLGFTTIVCICSREVSTSATKQTWGITLNAPQILQIVPMCAHVQQCI